MPLIFLDLCHFNLPIFLVHSLLKFLYYPWLYKLKRDVLSIPAGIAWSEISQEIAATENTNPQNIPSQYHPYDEGHKGRYYKN